MTDRFNPSIDFTVAAVLTFVLASCGKSSDQSEQSPFPPTSPQKTAEPDDSGADVAPTKFGLGDHGTGHAKQPGQLTRLHPEHEVWVDEKQKRVILGGNICLREGMLEMFACPRATKEHESVVSVNAPAYLVHTALLSIGAKPGHPVRYDPTYQPAEGPKINVEVIWQNADRQIIRRRAQDLIRHVKTDQAMKHDWLFAGSSFWQDEETGEQYYQAEGGELICLSNFSTATLDLPVESPRDNSDLLYEALTENIPPAGTKVRLVLSVKKQLSVP